MTQSDLQGAIDAEAARELAPFHIFDDSAVVTESTSKKISRSVAFRETVCRLYTHSCVVCGTALKSPSGTVELDAAHIVPRSRLGSNEARNGIALCKRHHWAFDNGLFGVSNNFEVLVPAHVANISQNSSLIELNGNSLRTPANPTLAPHHDALEWHRNNVMLRV